MIVFPLNDGSTCAYAVLLPGAWPQQKRAQALLPASAYFKVERCALVITLVSKIKLKKKVRLKSNDRTKIENHKLIKNRNVYKKALPISFGDGDYC